MRYCRVNTTRSSRKTPKQIRFEELTRLPLVRLTRFRTLLLAGAFSGNAGETRCLPPPLIQPPPPLSGYWGGFFVYRVNRENSICCTQKQQGQRIKRCQFAVQMKNTNLTCGCRWWETKRANILI